MNLDNANERKVELAARWYRLTPEQYLNSIVRQHLDRLVAEVPNLEEAFDLS